MKIGIIGGSFNPPHLLHKQMGIEVLKHHLVEKVIYVPTGDGYPKNHLLKGNTRYEMVKRMCKDIPNMEVSDYEIQKGQSYTYETLDYFQKQYPQDDIYFILSMDLLLDIESWKKPDYILSHYHLIGLQRKGWEGHPLPKIYSQYLDRIQIYDFDLAELSSTQIRDRMEKKEDVKEYLDKRVYDYIFENHLYESFFF